MHRRAFALGLGGIVAGALGVHAFTGTSEAVRVDMQQPEIADESVETPTAVNGVTLSIQGEWGWKTSTTPTRAVMRISATYAGETAQLEGWEIPGQLEPSHSGEFDKRTNLLSHPEITAPDLSPQEIGETNSLTYTTHVTLSVYGESGKLGEHTISDAATIEVTRRQATVEATLSATGAVTVSTRTPS